MTENTTNQESTNQQSTGQQPSKDPVKRALTQRHTHAGSTVEEANAKLVYTVWFAIAMLVCLTALEIVYLALMGTWNSEVFAAITGLSGTVLGIFLAQKS